MFSAITRDKPLNLAACGYNGAWEQRRTALVQLAEFVESQRGEYGHLLALDKAKMKQQWPHFIYWMHTFVVAARTHNVWVEERLKEERGKNRKGAKRIKDEKQIMAYKTRATFKILPMPSFTHNYMSIGVETLPVRFGGCAHFATFGVCLVAAAIAVTPSLSHVPLACTTGAGQEDSRPCWQ